MAWYKAETKRSEHIDLKNIEVLKNVLLKCLSLIEEKLPRSCSVSAVFKD